MKKLLKNSLFIFFLFQLTIGVAQNAIALKPEKNVPQIVLEAFARKFPSQDPVWFRQYEGSENEKLRFEAKFIFDNRYSSAIYENEGSLIAFAAKIETKEIPQKALQYMSENLPNYPISEALLVTRGGSDVTYEIGIYINNQYIIEVFDKDGNYIKRTKS